MSAAILPVVQPGIPVQEYSPAAGDHLCSLWTDPATDRRAAASFLGAAHEQDRGVWILDPSRSEASALSASILGGPPIAQYLTDQVHVVGGVFIPERMRQFWRDRAAEARAVGAPHLRAVAEMAWALRQLPGTDEAPEFESSLNPLLATLPTSVICQYGSTRFTSDTLLAMILSHPLVMIGERVFTNPFSVDHDQFTGAFGRLRADSRAALLPIWSHFLGRLSTRWEIATFLCNSLPTLIRSEAVWVSLDGLESPVALAVDEDRVDATSEAALRLKSLDRSGRLYAFWPNSSHTIGGYVQFGTVGGKGALEAIYEHNRGRLVVARTDSFTRAEISRFATVAALVAATLVSPEDGSGNDAHELLGAGR